MTSIPGLADRDDPNRERLNGCSGDVYACRSLATCESTELGHDYCGTCAAHGGRPRHHCGCPRRD